MGLVVLVISMQRIAQMAKGMNIALNSNLVKREDVVCSKEIAKSEELLKV